MMLSKSISDNFLTLHYSDEILGLLQEISSCYVTFKDLTGTIYPWEITDRRMKLIEIKFAAIERKIEYEHPDDAFCCVISEKGAFWLFDESIENFFQNQEKTSQYQKKAPFPTWKLSISELLYCYIRDLRLLVLCVTRDLYLIQNIECYFDESQPVLHRDFNRFKQHLVMLLEDLSRHIPTVTDLMHKNVEMYDRITITEQMIEKEEYSISETGYSVEDLIRSKKILEQKIKKIVPGFTHRLKSMRQMFQTGIQDCEGIQLHRNCHWEMIYGYVGHQTDKYKHQQRLAHCERKSEIHIVNERENELGETCVGQLAVQNEERVKEAEKFDFCIEKKEKKEEKEKQEAKEPAQQPENESQKEETKDEGGSGSGKKHEPRRMAFIKRRIQRFS